MTDTPSRDQLDLTVYLIGVDALLFGEITLVGAMFHPSLVLGLISAGIGLLGVAAAIVVLIARLAALPAPPTHDAGLQRRT